MIVVKSHTAHVVTVSDAIDDDDVVIGLERSEAITVRGQLTPKSHVASFEALGVEVERPFKFLYDKADYGKMPIGAEVTFEEEPAERFIVVGPERLHSIDNVASHCSVWLSNLRVTPVEVVDPGSGGSGS